MTQFAGIKMRMSNARKKHLKDQEKLAPKRWLLSSYNGKTPYEAWKEEFIKYGMEEWDSGMSHQVAAMKSRINKGYAVTARKHKKCQHWEQEKVDDQGDGVVSDFSTPYEFTSHEQLASLKEVDELAAFLCIKTGEGAAGGAHCMASKKPQHMKGM
ncbi:hypothetical protein L7F22_064713 [Adiantum nelumboides]|nr:hypothetical protein [Adiantum nelumboides]